MDTRLIRWRNRLKRRIPKNVAGKTKSREAGVSRPPSQRITLISLIRAITPENRHAETGWGTPRGREVW